MRLFELMFFLSKLQTNLPQENEGFDRPRAISRAVDEALKSMDSVINRQLSDIEYNIIQITNRCFIAILDDNLLPKLVKNQIRHLQIPYIKAALLDATLFVDETHPF